MNVVISGVTSTASAFQDNGSDDDVIEVVRDVEAPIEILSDEEELELQKSNQKSVITIQNYHFTSLPLIHYAPKDDSKRQLEDPLKSVSNNCNDKHNSYESSDLSIPVVAVPLAENDDSPLPLEKSLKEGNDESSFVNVTDIVDKPIEMPENEQNEEPVTNLGKDKVTNERVVDETSEKTADTVHSTEEQSSDTDKASEIIVDNKD